MLEKKPPPFTPSPPYHPTPDPPPHLRCGILCRFQRTPHGLYSFISSNFEKYAWFIRVAISRYLQKIFFKDFHLRCGILYRFQRTPYGFSSFISSRFDYLFWGDKSYLRNANISVMVRRKNCAAIPVDAQRESAFFPL